MAEDVAVASSATPSPATPSTAPSASSTPASASATPTSGPSTPVASSTPAEPGPIPYARFKEVNDQLKAARDYQQKYGWATQFEQDPYTFVDNWVDQLASHPQYGPQIIGKMARMLQARRGQSTAAPQEPQPDVPLTDAAGNPTGQYTYSAKQLAAWRDWDWQQKSQQLDQRIAPLEQLQQRVEQQQAIAQIAQQSDASARQTLAELRQDPYFKQYEADVKQALMEHEEWGDNVHRAYHHVLQTKVFPTIGTTAQQRVLDTLQTQAAGATPNPGMTAPTQQPQFRKKDGSPDFGAALEYYAAHPEEAERMARR